MVNIMSISKLSIEGLRGFSKKIEINFALPDKKNKGSGLTVLVGPNNSGKSTVIEAIHLLSTNSDTIPITARNEILNGQVHIKAEDNNLNKFVLSTTNNGGSFIIKKCNGEDYYDNKLNVFILSNKRNFNSTFNSNNNQQSREGYLGNVGNNEYRNENNINNNFGSRLLSIYNRRELFDNCLKRLINPIPSWTIESLNTSNSYLEFSFGETKHSSQGAGDGYINIFNIVDALYDSTEDNVILIDEPEISLHPDLQRKLFDLLIEYSKDKQIIISTHSSYFVDWDMFSKNSKIIRLKKQEDIIEKYELKDDTKKKIQSILHDANNPHVLSLNTNEIFFLNDNVILTEGQDDVLCYKKIFEQFNFDIEASFFGWGAGGADKVNIILSMLYDLGYKKVFTILDNDKKYLIDKLKEDYPMYGYYSIQANDVRTKEDKKMNKIVEKIEKIDIEKNKREEVMTLLQSEAKNVEGLITSMKTYSINEKFIDDINNLIDSIRIYFKGNNNEMIESPKVEENNILNEDMQKAKRLLERYLSKFNMHNYFNKKYKKIEFAGGSGEILSIKQNGKNKYYAIVECNEVLSKKYYVSIIFQYNINVETKEIKLLKKRVIENTLPINPIYKIIEKIFN